MRPIGTPKKLELHRFRAMALLNNGMSGVELTEMLDVTSGVESQWNKRYQRAGPDASRKSRHVRTRLLPRRRIWLAAYPAIVHAEPRIVRLRSEPARLEAVGCSAVILPTL